MGSTDWEGARGRALTAVHIEAGPIKIGPPMGKCGRTGSSSGIFAGFQVDAGGAEKLGKEKTIVRSDRPASIRGKEWRK
jgi:hypothetical protein